MTYEQQIAASADRYYDFHAPKFASLQEERNRLLWVQERTLSIVEDDDYLPDLIQYMLEENKGVNVFIHLRNATAGDSIGALAHYHEYLTKQARKIAESEASVRFGF